MAPLDAMPVASMSGMENYEKAVKPPLSPPAWLFPIVWTNTKYRMVYLNMGHGDEGFIDATQNLLFVNAFRWVVSRAPNGDPFKK